MEGDTIPNWSESIEDLVNSGEIDKAISVLESLTSNLQTQNPSLLFDLANLYSTKGLSLKADQTRSRALTIKHISNQKDLKIEKQPVEHSISTSIGLSQDGYLGKSSQLPDDVLSHEDCAEDDWEAIADRAPDELLSSPCVPGVSKLSLEDTKVQTPKRRGRGTFSYKKQGLYSDQQADEPGPEPVFDDSDDEVSTDNSKDAETRDLKYGTRHVLVLADFSPSSRTTDLEKLLENFKDRGFVIRWVNDTVALAVFRTPSIALEARNFIQCPFTVRVLDENDVLLSSIPPRDLEPPRQRPQTSARTAQRLIANVMGIKLPSTRFGSKDYKKQEEARKNRIVSRQHMRDDAWGDDVS